MKTYRHTESHTIYVCELCGTEDGNKEYLREHEIQCFKDYEDMCKPKMEESNTKSASLGVKE